MPKRLTQDEWIARAKAVHNDRYSYENVVYTNKSTKVTIRCHVHGLFEQLAGNHLQGKGCAKCSKNRRMNTEMFIEKAISVHDGVYDYSKTVFSRSRDKVIITCDLHGDFEQEANSHLKGAGCPTCGYMSMGDFMRRNDERVLKIKDTVKQRYGVCNVMQDATIAKRFKDSFLLKYGVSNPRHIPNYNEKYERTVRSKYGVAHYSQSSDFKRDVIDTCMTRYGVHNYTQSLEYKNRLSDIISKSKQTQKERYGAEHYAKSEIFRKKLPDMLSKGYITKKNNGTFATSKPEDEMYERLVDLYGEDDVVRQYSSDLYPFMCDFYIQSRDMYVELNASWTHGGHWYGSDAADDSTLEHWRKKESAYYDKAIETWTVRDVLKRKTAHDNDLIYLVFWDSDLFDFEKWVSDEMPIRKDF